MGEASREPSLPSNLMGFRSDFRFRMSSIERTPLFLDAVGKVGVKFGGTIPMFCIRKTAGLNIKRGLKGNTGVSGCRLPRERS